jgi:transcription elongation GreA/GreB family factor
MGKQPTETGSMFLTPIGQKFVQKRRDELEISRKGLLSEKTSGTRAEASEDEQSRLSAINTIESQIALCDKTLKLPVVEVKKQNKQCLHGNGVKLQIDGKHRYVVIDGVSVCEHRLPKNHAIISAISPLGKALIGMKVGDSGSFKVDEKESKFVVEEIDFPSKAEQLFYNRQSNELKEKTEQPEMTQN